MKEIRLLKSANGSIERTEEEKQHMIAEAAMHYGRFLTAMGFDYKADENSKDTPMRVAKAWVNDIISGCVSPEPRITAFPNENYNGMVVQTFIPVKSLCSHHNLPITGYAHVAYIPTHNGKVIGLSKLNRIVDYVGKRPQLQEELTQMVHDMIHEQCEKNMGVAVMVQARHFCTCHRGVHHDSLMSTQAISGAFMRNDKNSKEEFLKHIEMNYNMKH